LKLAQESDADSLFWNNADKTLVVKEKAAQSANLTEWQNSAGTVLSSVTAAGGGYFSANVGIGTSTPARKLHISEAMRLEPISGSQPTAPSMGDLYSDGDTGTLCYYDGSTWVAVAGGTNTCN
jgi:hypothetical protein